jgi:hypothetical protein
MKPRLALIALTLAAAAAPASAAAPTATVKLTIPGTGLSCVLTTASTSCQGSTSAITMSGTVTPSGQVTTCRQPQGASPSCVLFPGASYKDVFMQQPEPTAGPFACIPVGNWFKAKGAVCTVASTGVGFRITPNKVTKVNQIPAGPHPPCTRAALSAGLARALHKRSLAPSHLTRGSRCAGNYAWADYIDIHGPGTGDDITVVYRAKGRRWQPVSRAKVCVTGELPAKIYLACTVN